MNYSFNIFLNGILTENSIVWYNPWTINVQVLYSQHHKCCCSQFDNVLFIIIHIQNVHYSFTFRIFMFIHNEQSLINHVYPTPLGWVSNNKFRTRFKGVYSQFRIKCVLHNSIWLNLVERRFILSGFGVKVCSRNSKKAIF